MPINIGYLSYLAFRTLINRAATLCLRKYTNNALCQSFYCNFLDIRHSDPPRPPVSHCPPLRPPDLSDLSLRSFSLISGASKTSLLSGLHTRTWATGRLGSARRSGRLFKLGGQGGQEIREEEGEEPEDWRGKPAVWNRLENACICRRSKGEHPCSGIAQKVPVMTRG